MISYKLHLLQHLKDTDKSARKDLCTQMQEMLEEAGFDDSLVFSNENTRIWGAEHPHSILEHV